MFVKKKRNRLKITNTLRCFAVVCSLGCFRKQRYLMQDSGIIRNRKKIQATISNAQHFLEVQKEFGCFCRYLKSFLPEGKPIMNHWKSLTQHAAIRSQNSVNQQFLF